MWYVIVFNECNLSRFCQIYENYFNATKKKDKVICTKIKNKLKLMLSALISIHNYM